MAKIVESTGDDAKAKARHAKIANEKKEAEEKARAKISDDKWKARRAEERRKEEIKKLPREERAAAGADKAPQGRREGAEEGAEGGRQGEEGGRQEGGRGQGRRCRRP